VEPKYEKKIETLEELLNSDVVYCYSPQSDANVLYSGSSTFIGNNELTTECRDMRKNIVRMITKKDIAITEDPFYVTYVAREMGTVDVGKTLCSLDKTLLSGFLTILFKKGSPLLDKFNFLMRRFLEAGLLERLMAELHHEDSLRAEDRYREENGGVFCPLTFKHLMPAFFVLFVGTVLSSVVFIGELTLNCLYKRNGKYTVRALG